jgi:carboxynorspermidine decarboxylase
MVRGSDRYDPTPWNPDGRPYFRGFNPERVPSPCYVIDRAAVEWNLRILREVADRAGATMLLALKAFAPPPLFPLFRKYLDGACASGLYEALLAREEIAHVDAEGAPAAGGRPMNQRAAPFQVHTFAPAYTTTEFARILNLSDHVVFNSLDQWLRFREFCLEPTPSQGARPGARPEARPGARPESRTGSRPDFRRRRTFGLRVNPECSLGSVPLYDPCAPGSRLGTTADELARALDRASGHNDPLDGITEVHFHTLCEDDSQALEKTLEALDERFGQLLRDPRITTLNMGGGHHITRPDYDRKHLIQLIRQARTRYAVEVILEPGEAAAIHSGVLVTTVLDLHRNGMELAILDTSATAHMPDTLEMPYRPGIWGAGDPASTPEAPNGFPTYRLGGQTCLAGDVIGDYRFTDPLQVGDRLIFDDMSHYTMVKTTTFNGIALPSIAVWDSTTGTLETVRAPEYRDFRDRLG